MVAEKRLGRVLMCCIQRFIKFNSFQSSLRVCDVRKIVIIIIIIVLFIASEFIRLMMTFFTQKVANWKWNECKDYWKENHNVSRQNEKSVIWSRNGTVVYWFNVYWIHRASNDGENHFLFIWNCFHYIFAVTSHSVACIHWSKCRLKGLCGNWAKFLHLLIVI